MGRRRGRPGREEQHGGGKTVNYYLNPVSDVVEDLIQD